MALVGVINFLSNLAHNIWFYIICAVIILALVILNFQYRGRKSLEEINSHEALESFVRNAMREQHLESNIKKVLLNEGWPEKQIELTMGKVKGERRKKIFGIELPLTKSEEEKIADEADKIIKSSHDPKSRIELEKLFEEATAVRKREDEFTKLAGYSNISGINKMKEGNRDEKVVGKDVIKVLLMADNLLEKLPEDELNRFSKSKDFGLFKKIMQEAKKNQTSKLLTKKMTLKELMALSEKGLITKEEARQIVGMPNDAALKKKKEKIDVKSNDTDGSNNPDNVLAVSREAEEELLNEIKLEEEKNEKLKKEIEQEKNELGVKLRLIEEEEGKLQKKHNEIEQEEMTLKNLGSGQSQQTSKVEPIIIHDEHITDEMKDALKVIDGLLVKLPHEDIVAFAKSSDYEKYAKVMSEVLGQEPKKPLSNPPKPSSSQQDEKLFADMPKGEKAETAEEHQKNVEMEKIKAAIKARLKQ